MMICEGRNVRLFIGDGSSALYEVVAVESLNLEYKCIDSTLTTDCFNDWIKSYADSRSLSAEITGLLCKSESHDLLSKLGKKETFLVVIIIMMKSGDRDFMPNSDGLILASDVMAAKTSGNFLISASMRMTNLKIKICNSGRFVATLRSVGKVIF